MAFLNYRHLDTDNKFPYGEMESGNSRGCHGKTDYDRYVKFLTDAVLSNWSKLMYTLKYWSSGGLDVWGGGGSHVDLSFLKRGFVACH